MKKADVNKYKRGTAEYVVMHAKWQRSRGRKPSVIFINCNPERALITAERMAYFPKSGIYLDGKIPGTYKCTECGASGLKLWREYNSFTVTLLCAKCAGRNQGKNIDNIDPAGFIGDDHDRTDQIGWFIPAVPDEDSESYWGYTSVPDPACDWWRNLPTLLKARITPMQFRMAADTCLDGINFGILLTSIKLPPDGTGNVEEHVITNIKKSLRVAIKMAQDEIVKSKCQKFLEFLKEY